MKFRTTALILSAVLLFSTAAFAQDANSTSTPLDRFTVTPHGVKTAVVADASGQVFGIVQAVATDKTGRPRTFTVQMPGGRTLQVDAARATYDFAIHRVTADDAAVLRTAQGLETPKS